MTTDRDPLPDELETTAGVYELLGHFFLHEPRGQPLDELIGGPRGKQLRELGYDLTGDLAALSTAERETELAVEYCRLFVGPGPHLSPHESVLLGEARHWGQAAVAVNAVYGRAGFELAPGTREMPDHIGVQFGFLASLSLREHQQRSAGQLAEAETLAAARVDFLQQHLARCLPILCEQLQARCKWDFYRELARLASDFVSAELGAITPC